MGRMLDLCCGEWGWARVFAARGWECVGVDVKHHPEKQPGNAVFVRDDIRNLTAEWITSCGFTFGCASTPCEKFSVFGLKMWHPNPPYPQEAIELFNHAREIFEDAGIPYVMENVRTAQKFVGKAETHCGPFYLWGNAVPPLMPQGITKGSMIWSARYRNMKKSQRKREVASIPPELAHCVADYAERLTEHATLTPCRSRPKFPSRSTFMQTVP